MATCSSDNILYYSKLCLQTLIQVMRRKCKDRAFLKNQEPWWPNGLQGVFSMPSLPLLESQPRQTLVHIGNVVS